MLPSDAVKVNKQERKDLQRDGLAKIQVKTFSVLERKGKERVKQKNQNKIMLTCHSILVDLKSKHFLIGGLGKDFVSKER